MCSNMPHLELRERDIPLTRGTYFYCALEVLPLWNLVDILYIHVYVYDWYFLGGWKFDYILTIYMEEHVQLHRYDFLVCPKFLITFFRFSLQNYNEISLFLTRVFIGNFVNMSQFAPQCYVVMFSVLDLRGYYNISKSYILIIVDFVLFHPHTKISFHVWLCFMLFPTIFGITNFWGRVFLSHFMFLWE